MIIFFLSELQGFDWSRIGSKEEVTNIFNFPQLKPEKFSQIWEVTSIHGVKKAQSVHSHLRRSEVILNEDPEDYIEYMELLKMPLENAKVEVLRLDEPTSKFKELQLEGIFKEWPGPGYVFRTSCAPAHRSDTSRAAFKTPTIFLLDSEVPNLLHCSDIYQRIGSMYCYNCPSLNGSISSCCHLAYLLLWLSADYVLEKSVNRGVRMVNIKNPFSFLHPGEIMSNTHSIPIPTVVNRTSDEKRPNCPLYGRSKFMYLTETADSDESDIDLEPQGNHGDVGVEQNLASEAAPIQSVAFEEQEDISSECPALPETNNLNRDNNIQIEPAPSISTTSTVSYFGQGRTTDIEKFIGKHTRRNQELVIPEIVDFQGNWNHIS